MRGGWPWRAARNPIECSLYIDVRTIHDQNSMDVKQELEEIIEGLRSTDEDLEAEVELYVMNPGVALGPLQPGRGSGLSGPRDVDGCSSRPCLQAYRPRRHPP